MEKGKELLKCLLVLLLILFLFYIFIFRNMFPMMGSLWTTNSKYMTITVDNDKTYKLKNSERKKVLKYLGDEKHMNSSRTTNLDRDAYDLYLDCHNYAGHLYISTGLKQSIFNFDSYNNGNYPIYNLSDEFVDYLLKLAEKAK